ncbi:MAG: phosphotransacetylase family protein [Nitrospirae bacterium]|nr:MAG: phosphotransacetylase family protein [Nitrospirota bacterium]
MKRLYIGSMTGQSGKQVITLGLGLALKKRGLEIGYIKPIGKSPLYVDGKLVDADAEVFHRAVGLEEPLEKTSPLVYTIELLRKAMTGRLKNTGRKLLKEIETLQAELVLIAGTTDIFEGSLFGVNGLRICQMEGTKALIVERWRPEETVDDLLAAKELLGSALAGTVINRVDPQSLKEVQKEVVPFLKRHGIKVFGVVPDEKALSAVTVKDLVDALGAKVISGREHLDALVENFSIGAMDVTHALRYFQRIPKKAVITGAHRADIQMAALETSTRCIILTGGGQPNDVIIARAREKAVPILSVRTDTYTTVDRIEALLGSAKMRDPQRLPLVRDLVERHIDIKGLLRAI